MRNLQFITILACAALFALLSTPQSASAQEGDELDDILREVSAGNKTTPVKRAVAAADDEPLPPVVGPGENPPKGSVILDGPKPLDKTSGKVEAETKPIPITIPDEGEKVTERTEGGTLPPGIEETRIYTMRNIKLRKAGTKEWESARIPVPVYYRSRSIAWGQEQLRNAFALQQRIKGYMEKLELLKREGTMLLEEYNKLIISGIPEEVLGNESPSIPEGVREQSLAQPLRGRDIKIEVKK